MVWSLTRFSISQQIGGKYQRSSCTNSNSKLDIVFMESAVDSGLQTYSPIPSQFVSKIKCPDIVQLHEPSYYLAPRRI